MQPFSSSTKGRTTDAGPFAEGLQQGTRSPKLRRPKSHLLVDDLRCFVIIKGADLLASIDCRILLNQSDRDEISMACSPRDLPPVSISTVDRSTSIGDAAHRWLCLMVKASLKKQVRRSSRTIPCCSDDRPNTELLLDCCVVRCKVVNTWATQQPNIANHTNDRFGKYLPRRKGQHGRQLWAEPALSAGNDAHLSEAC